MMKVIQARPLRLAAPLLATLPALAATAAHAGGPNLETFVMSTNGRASDYTFGVPDAVRYTFGASVGDYIPQDAVSDPSVLASENLAGTYRVTDSATAPMLTDSYGSSGTNPPGSPFSYTFSGSTTATAQYGQLKSGSQATMSGYDGDQGITNTAESYATMLDTLTPTSPYVISSTTGSMTLAFTVDGSLSINGGGSVGMDLLYNYSTNGSTPSLVNTTGILLQAQATIYGNGYGFGVNSSYGSGTTPPGMSTTVGPLSSSGSPSYLTFGGSTTLYATIPIVFGSATTFDLGMITYVGPGGDSTVSSLFDDTATLSGIQVFDNNGNPVNDFTIASGSGTDYDANGVHLTGSDTAPEPGSIALLASVALSGLPVLGSIARRRRQAWAGAK